jgi:hypothetical protein
MARFAQYAMVAAEEALGDAGWEPKGEEELESTVCDCHVGESKLMSVALRAYIWGLGLGAWTMWLIRLLRIRKVYVFFSFCKTDGVGLNMLTMVRATRKSPRSLFHDF